MANNITPSLRASLERIKHAGAVNGICLAWRRQVLVSLMPYEDFRSEQLVQILHDSREHFQSGGRYVDSLWMGFMDVHVLVVFAGDISIVLLHTRQEESDFLTGVVKTFLNDAQLLVAAALSPASESPSEEGEEDENWLPQPPRLDPNQTHVVA